MSGVPGLGEIGWGSHFCHFYESANDLADTLVPYFQAGLENNEACLWVASEPFTANEAWSALSEVVPDLDQRERAGQIEIVDHEEWYRKSGQEDARGTLRGWIERETEALSRGFSGLRLTGNTYWLDRLDWDSFIEYESLVNEAFRSHRIVGLCSYCLDRCSPSDVLDVVRTHQFAVTRRSGSWEVIESASLKLARQDLMRLKESERELREADRRKDEFLAMLAHELRNPLMPIRSGIDLLVLENGEHGDTLQLMKQQVEHLVRLVDDLLDVSRIMRGRIELRREPVELATIVRRSVEAVRSTIREQEQVLLVSLPDEPIWLNADPVRIAQVFENLLHNASKYNNRKGRIEIAAECDEAMVIVVVRDNGVGIDHELLPRVFEMFTQSARSLDRAQGGLGIGLTLVRSLVEMHGGSVSVRSEGADKGSEFIVRLPVGHLPPEATPAVEPVKMDKRRVLVVDDNGAAAKMLSLLLAKLGPCETDMAADGPSALEKIGEFRPDIVLLDIGLPGMDGYQVVRKIRSRREFDEVLLVAITGYGQEEDRRRSQEAGFDEHLVKPPALESVMRLLTHAKLSPQ